MLCVVAIPSLSFSTFYGTASVFLQTFDISVATFLSIYSGVSMVVHGFGVLNAAHAVMKVKFSRAAIVWSISLISLPWVAIPLYWILAKSKFQGYSATIQAACKTHRDLVELAYSEILDFKASLSDEFSAIEKIADTFTGLPFTTHNAVKLLTDGEETYLEMLDAIVSLCTKRLFCAMTKLRALARLIRTIALPFSTLR